RVLFRSDLRVSARSPRVPGRDFCGGIVAGSPDRHDHDEALAARFLRAKVLPFDEILGMPVAAARRERQVNDFVRARLGERLGELDVRMLERFERYHGRLGLVAETGRRREVAMDV